MSDSDEVTPLSYEVISTMTFEEYERRRSEIQKWMRNHPFGFREEREPHPAKRRLFWDRLRHYK